MRERADAASGHLVVRSEPGKGSIVRASIPYAFEGVRATASGQATETDDRTEPAEAGTERVGFLARLFGR
jgi:hypothetical protein